ncbi:MAG: hypothetical protein K2F79_01200, partial [Muribaculaceae bacterium]|nr:hypothetical protein [Muribaculaceae bacterium]
MILSLRSFRNLMALAAAGVLGGCTVAVPDNYSSADVAPRLSPDYSSVTIPCNIAPMNFRIEDDGDEFITRLTTVHGGPDDGITVAGRTLDIPAGAWHRLIGNAAGDTLIADIYVRRGDSWTRYPAIRNAIADSIDPYISYRLIEPSYISFETMAICQRDLTGF